MVEDHTTVNGKNAEPIILTNDNIQDILIEKGILKAYKALSIPLFFIL